jgi:hypothetical protein
MKAFAPIRAALAAGIPLSLAIFFAFPKQSLFAQTASPAESVPPPSGAGGQTIAHGAQSGQAGPRRLSEAEADLQQGNLTVWVPRTYYCGTQDIPAEERHT